MRRPVAAVAAVLLLLAGCDEEPALPALGPDAVVVAFGDSLTYGTGVDEEEAYPEVLARLTGLDVRNEGVPGELTPAGLERLRDLLDSDRPDLLVICHGGNDFLRRRSAAETERNLSAMVAEATGRGVPVVLLGVPEPGIVLASHPLYARVAGAAGVPIDDEIVPELLSTPGLKSDAVHPNATGYARLAESVHDLLVRSGALAPGRRGGLPRAFARRAHGRLTYAATRRGDRVA